MPSSHRAFFFRSALHHSELKMCDDRDDYVLVESEFVVA